MIPLACEAEESELSAEPVFARLSIVGEPCREYFRILYCAHSVLGSCILLYGGHLGIPIPHLRCRKGCGESASNLTPHQPVAVLFLHHHVCSVAQTKSWLAGGWSIFQCRRPATHKTHASNLGRQTNKEEATKLTCIIHRAISRFDKLKR